MITDNLVAFLPIGSNLALSLATAGSVQSNVVDILGAGVGVAPPNIIGNATLFGTDPGVGGLRPELNIAIGTAPTTSNSATLTVQYQAAPDTAVTFLPGAWTTIAEQPGLTVANMVAGAVVARFPFLPAMPPGLNARYLRLNFVTLTATAFTAGTIAFALVTMVRDDQANRYAASNFKVA